MVSARTDILTFLAWPSTFVHFWFRKTAFLAESWFLPRFLPHLVKVIGSFLFGFLIVILYDSIVLYSKITIRTAKSPMNKLIEFINNPLLRLYTVCSTWLGISPYLSRRGLNVFLAWLHHENQQMSHALEFKSAGL